MAWSTGGSTGLSFLPKVAKGLLGWGGLGAAGIWEGRDWFGDMAQKYPGLLGLNPALTLGAAAKATEGGFKTGIKGLDQPNEYRSPDSAGTAAPAQTMDAFQKSMAKSVKTAATEDTEEEDPFNYNQLFIASILKGLKQKPPATSSGRASGTYIPKPDLPKMSDYDSNKTYWNIG